MKKFIIAIVLAFLAVPSFASAHPALSQHHVATGRPTVSQPTGPVGFSGFNSQRTGCEWFVDGKLSYCFWETRAAMLMLANLK